jgi:hypothetical protein
MNQTQSTVCDDNDWNRLNFCNSLFGQKSCWIRNGRANLIFFGAPTFLIIIVNGLFYFLAIFNIRKKSLAQKESKLRRFSRVKLPGDYHVKFYIQMAVIMGFTWLLGYLTAVTDDDIFNLILVYVFLVLNSSTGLFIFVVFICKKEVALLYAKMVRTLLKLEDSKSKQQLESISRVSVMSEKNVKKKSGGGGGDGAKKKVTLSSEMSVTSQSDRSLFRRTSVSMNTLSTVSADAMSELTLERSKSEQTICSSLKNSDFNF